MTHLGDDDDSFVHSSGVVHSDRVDTVVIQERPRDPFPSFDLHLTPTPHIPEQPIPHSSPEHHSIQRACTDDIQERPGDPYPSFDLHLTPTSHPPPDDTISDQPPPVRRSKRPTECPPRDHSLTFFYRDDASTIVGSSQSSDGSVGRRKFGICYVSQKCEKRARRHPKCGTNREKGAKN
ncbi:hypothetical protein AgCh_018912 [Apium graveolens]